MQNKKIWLPKTPMGESIPKIIHQTSPNKELPPEIKSNIEKIKKLNPDWEYRLYDDAAIESFIQKNYPPLMQFYKKINPKYGAAKADFFRYLVIYKEGGLYLDIKSSISKPLSQIIQPFDKIVLSHWCNKKGEKYPGWGIHKELSNPNGEFQQWFILSVPSHPFLHATITRVIDNIQTYSETRYVKRRKDVLYTTGPIAFTLAIEPLLPSFEHRLFRNNRELGFVYSIYLERQGHHCISKKMHYSRLKEPVILSLKSKFSYSLRILKFNLRKILNPVLLPLKRWTK